MLAAFPGTGDVESNFSIVQGMSSHRRAGVSTEVLRACVKIALDGPRAEEFVPGRHKWVATPLLVMAQNCYYKMFGGRCFKKDRDEAAWGGLRGSGLVRKGQWLRRLRCGGPS